MNLTPLGRHSEFTAIPHWQMVARLKTIPLEHSLKVQFYELFRKWSSSSGPSWAVERTKTLRDCIMQSRAHQGLTHKPEWVATSRSGNLRGTYGQLYRVAMASYKGFRAVLYLLNIYTVWTRNTLDPVSRTAITEEVNQAPVVRGSSGSPGSKLIRKLQALWLSKGQAFNHQHGLKRPQRVRCKLCVPLTQVLPGKKSHIADLGIDIFRIKRSMPYNLHPLAIRQALGGSLLEEDQLSARRLWAENASEQGCSPDEIRDTLERYEKDHMIFSVEAISNSIRKRHVGRVNYTHEPGLKTRYFAAPNIVIQRALEPLKDGLFRILRRVPWDCTLHQHKADDYIISSMQKGKTVHTVDMSKATDNFPWEYQKAVLHMVINTRDPYTRDLVGLLIDTVEKGEWHLDSGRKLRRLRWSKGQPLGLGPSFPLFSLTHGLVLFTLNEGRWDQKFFVLGDDVIIFDDLLANKYKKWLSTVEVKISEAKTFSSSEVGQFAGKTYTPYGAFWTPKWTRFTRSNVIDICAWWYPGLSEVFPKDRKTIDWVLSLPSPFGNGWNPTGLSLDDRLTPDIIDSLLERDRLREEKSLPTAIDCRLSRLRTALKEAGLNAQSILDAACLRVEEHRAVKIPNRDLTSVPPERYAPETEVPGAPPIRHRVGRVDPYSKGTLSSWKSMLAL